MSEWWVGIFTVAGFLAVISGFITKEPELATLRVIMGILWFILGTLMEERE